MLKEDELFEELKKAIEDSDRIYDLDMIDRAYELAKKAHEGQVRKSGEHYVCHPIQVAEILVGIGMDTESVVAGILHDVVEDTEITLEELAKDFGDDVAVLVDGVTKIGQLEFETREEQQQENIRKMLLAMNTDIRVIIIKLADRLHNMRTLNSMTRAKQKEKAKETMDVYAPIAHRLGISEIKEELEDLALYYLHPIEYKKIEALLSNEREDREAFLDNLSIRIKERLHDDGIECEVQARIKSIYGIYRKMYLKGKNFNEIYDIYALRVIVDTIVDCYTVLGIVHDMFTLIPNRFKDYISTPKPNMYQSLHTTMIEEQGIPFEVQIRTWDMHHTAELGIAAHWKYKSGVSGGKDSIDDRISWIRQLIEAQDDDVDDIVNIIKTDLGQEEVFVFTPQGDVKILPAGSNIIDFAYSIHSEVGNHMVGAKVDNRIMNIYHEVQTGEIIEIITSKNPNQGPSRDWINKVKTSSARGKIRSWFKKERKEENIATGKEMVEKEMKRQLIRLKSDEEEKVLMTAAKKFGLDSIDEMYAAIGYGGLTTVKVMTPILDEYKKLKEKENPPVEPAEKKKEKDLPKFAPKKNFDAKGDPSSVIVEGVDGLLVKFAQCCSPVPGDEIVGYITRGYGVSIHKADCINVTSSMNDKENQSRWVRAHWANEVDESFRTGIEIIADSTPGIIADVSILLVNLGLGIHELNARENKDGKACITVNVSIENTDQLENSINALRQIDAVRAVKRIGSSD